MWRIKAVQGKDRIGERRDGLSAFYSAIAVGNRNPRPDSSWEAHTAAYSGLRISLFNGSDGMADGGSFDAVGDMTHHGPDSFSRVPHGK